MYLKHYINTHGFLFIQQEFAFFDFFNNFVKTDIALTEYDDIQLNISKFDAVKTADC